MSGFETHPVNGSYGHGEPPLLHNKTWFCSDLFKKPFPYGMNPLLRKLCVRFPVLEANPVDERRCWMIPSHADDSADDHSQVGWVEDRMSSSADLARAPTLLPPAHRVASTSGP